jgi:hypothetical protein
VLWLPRLQAGLLFGAGKFDLCEESARTAVALLHPESRGVATLHYQVLPPSTNQPTNQPTTTTTTTKKNKTQSQV